MHKKFQNLNNEHLLTLLDDCLTRAKDGVKLRNWDYVQSQIEKAKEVQKELSFRLGKVTLLQ